MSFIQYISLYWSSFSMNAWFVMLQCVSWLFLASPEDEAIKLQRRTSYLMATAKDRDSHKLSLDKTLSPSQSQTEIHLQWVPLWSHWIMEWKSNRHCHIFRQNCFFAFSNRILIRKMTGLKWALPLFFHWNTTQNLCDCIIFKQTLICAY